ncbi:MAG: hypothetical protein U9O20_01250 [Patescibacteria group bacterium]|nr:hypothetical protein [Patescibacteria group bacterium]
MFIIADKKKTELLLVLIGFVVITLLIEFFLSKIETDGVWEWALLSMVFFLFTPLFIVKKLWKKTFKEYFLSLDVSIKAIVISLTAVLIYVAVMWLLVVQLNWRGHLTVSRWILGSTGFLLFVDLVVMPFVIFAREFFFRGFILKSAVGVLGMVGAIVFQSILATGYDVYIGGFSDWVGAWPQIVLLLFFNAMLGFVALVSRSIIVTSIISWAHFLFVDLFFAYQLSNFS